jgi:hypothetical protein
MFSICSYMPTQAPSPQQAANDAQRAVEDFARPVLEEQLAGLRRLAEIELAIADDIRQASAEVAAARKAGAEAADRSAAPAARPNNVIDLAIARVSRAIRLTYAMQREVLEQLRRVGHIEEADAATAMRERAELSQARRGTAARVLTRIIQDEVFGADDGDTDADAAPESDDGAQGDLSDGAEHETYERLVREASECLRDRDRFGDVAGRPISEIIALICRDLGIDPDWLSLSEESWAREEIRSGLVGAALATLPAGPARPRPVRKPRPVTRPAPVPKPPPIAAPLNETLGDAETPAPPEPPPPIQPQPRDDESWREWEDPETRARRFALPGELPPPRRPRPGRRYWD